MWFSYLCVIAAVSETKQKGTKQSDVFTEGKNTKLNAPLLGQKTPNKKYLFCLLWRDVRAVVRNSVCVREWAVGRQVEESQVKGGDVHEKAKQHNRVTSELDRPFPENSKQQTTYSETFTLKFLWFSLTKQDIGLLFLRCR